MSHDSVTCKNVPIDNKEFFRGAHLVTAYLLTSIEFTLLEGEEWIPAQILDNKKTEKLIIQYDDRQGPVGLLQVD